MATPVSSINFLPAVFRSPTNQRFLGATVDQLIKDSAPRPISGYIGRTHAPTYKLGDNYIAEQSVGRQQYQLEPSIVIKDADNQVAFNSGYLDLISAIINNGGTPTDHQRLFGAEYYNYNGHFDYDKFVNYTDYYWMPNGPESVYVTAGQTPYQATYNVTRNTDVGGYTFTDLGGHPNTQITLARGGTYQFIVDQPGEAFWIQSLPGVDGVDPNTPTISTRSVFGVKNNGTDKGVVTFNVPLKTAQDFYVTMPAAGQVDTTFSYSYQKIQNRYLSDFITEFQQGLDGISNLLKNKTFIFLGNEAEDSEWVTPAYPTGFTADQTQITINPGDVIPRTSRSSIWQITLVPVAGGDSLIQISPLSPVSPRQKVFIKSGKTYASTQFWLENTYQYKQIPPITATADYLYYQDGTTGGFNGAIKLVDNTSVPIDIEQDIIGKVGYTSPNGVVFTNGLKVTFDTLVTPSTYADNTFYVEGVGTSINLVNVKNLIIPNRFASEITSTADYITINRASQDGNSWSATNRWFHKDVLAATAKYNLMDVVDYGPNIQGRRPIIEFDADMQLWQHGRRAKASVDLFIEASTDAFVDIEGHLSYTLDGINLVPGLRIIFSNDYDINVTNNIYQVSIEVINSQNFIRLVATADDPVLDGEVVFVKSGSNANKLFNYSSTTNSWTLCQPKTTFNQAPYFDLVDANGYSFGNKTVYSNSTFAGSRLFGYAPATGTNDTVLGFPVKYQNFNNIGDIVFNNYYDTDTFTYDDMGTVNCNSGYIAKNTSLTTQTTSNNWVAGVESTLQYQTITKFFDGTVLTIGTTEYAFVQLGGAPKNQATVPYTKVFKNNKLLVLGTDYVVTTYGVYNVVLLSALPAVGDKIDVMVYSSVNFAPQDIPANLNFNALNENFDTITLGQMRTHYNTLIENTSASTQALRPLRDSNLKAQGGTLLQHSSPLIYSMLFLTNDTANFTRGLDLARREYTKFKNKFLSLCGTLTNLDYTNPVTGVDTILQTINSIKNNTFPWYYSDMVPQGTTYSTIEYTVLNTRQTSYEISSIFNLSKLSNRAVIVYLNGVQLTAGIDYEFSTVSPAIDFLRTFNNGDTITIRDYGDTDGNYIPETPSKLGLYPKFVPEIYTDSTYQAPTRVIRGHDGSITPAFNDFRDEFLLELEKRIYNNIKADYNKNQLGIYDIIPGRFRKTEYSLTGWTKILTQNFLSWVGNNKLDYVNNTWYLQDNPWTWNYSAGFADVVDGSQLQGSWRAIYDYWFDTDTPNISPWEMLGFSTKPLWWETHYGVAPYTASNTTLWEDLEAGYIWNDGNPYIDKKFARPGLTKFIPVDNNGNLLAPVDIPLTVQYSTRNAGEGYSVGAQGPVETAWRRSSDYPYAVQMALAVTKPAKYFATQFDNSRFYINTVTGHFSDVNNQKIKPSLLTVNGTTTNGSVNRTSGYINWISDYIKNLGIDTSVLLSEYIQNMSVQLAYKCAGFVDQKMISVTAEQTSPGSKNSSVLIPDENYSVYLNKSVPLYSSIYSAVIVERVGTGYSVTGYDTVTPFFKILPSVANNNKTTFTINGIDYSVYKEAASRTATLIPYGHIFNTSQQVVDFLISYQRSLETNGFVFDQYDKDLQIQRDFELSAKEFAYWSQQGFPEGTIIVLSPASDILKVNSNFDVIDEITNLPGESRLLDQNFNPIKSNRFNIVRTVADAETNHNQTVVNTVDGSNIAYAKFNHVQYEHNLIFDNVDDFGDIIYLPKLGNRQYRLGIKGSITGNWNGSLSATGYVYSNPEINSWQPGMDYRLGDIVRFNNAYFLAAVDVPASQNFGSGNWTQIKQSDIQTGLLPSFGTNASMFENIYDIDNPPQDENLQKFSAGLIGFRERPYLTDLGLSIGSQAKFYQGYIKQKGTISSINALTRATFNNVTGNLKVYEEWAFRTGTYGDVNNNLYNEFVLDQSVFTTNPVAVQLTNNYNSSNVVVNLAVTGNTLTSNVYNSSNVYCTSTALYSNRSLNSGYMNDLPYAGYANVNDIDGTIFDVFSQSQEFNYGIGDKIWVAKDTDSRWNIYRVDETELEVTTLTYTLDNYVRATFNNPHDFKVGDFVVIKDFAYYADGIFRVTAVSNQLSVTFQVENKTHLSAIISVSPAKGVGRTYRLTPFVINDVTEIENLRPLNDWRHNEKVWVNNATTIGWGVYNFNRPWLGNTTQKIFGSNVAEGHYGTSVAYSQGNIYVGSPGTRSVQVVGNVNFTFSPNVTITGTEADFGSVVAAAGNVLIVSAPGSNRVHVYNNLVHAQTITGANASGNFGSTLALNQYGNVLYVGEATAVHAYTVSGGAFVPTANVAANVTALSTNGTGSVLVIGASDDFDTYKQNGKAYVYQFAANTFSNLQTISSQVKNVDASFGTSVAIDRAGNNIFIGSPYSTLNQQINGSVERYVLSSGSYVFHETIVHPDHSTGSFGTTVSVSPDANVLAVSSLGSSGEEDTTFDNNTTLIDDATTQFIDLVLNSGAVYTFEPLVNWSVANDVGRYNYIQELSAQVSSGYKFGSSVVAHRHLMIVGASGANQSAGKLYVYTNPNKTLAWNLIRQQQPKVDINSINRTFIFNKLNNNILTTLDYIDPIKGKVLNSVAVDIDYQRVKDPAIYNAGTGVTFADYHWGPEQVGKVWWNLDKVRYIDYEQDSLIYRLTHWGERFPGSTIEVSEWVESSVLPSQYTGDGMPLYPDNSSYSTYGYVDQSGNVKLKYYFWVTGKTTMATGKSNSVYSIASAIENPQTQNVAYATVLANNSVALYNVNNLLVGQSSVLHLSSRTVDSGVIHNEYALVQEGNPSSYIPDSLQLKMIDSLAGQDAAGNAVPDPNLTPAQAYGVAGYVKGEPRQSMFMDRATALSNFIEFVNTKLLPYQTTRRKVLTKFNSSEPAPNSSSGQYFQPVNTHAELSYIDTTGFADGTKVLVKSDSNYNGKWVIYAWNTATSTWTVARQQSYKTNAVDSNGVGLYWYYTDWYATGYDKTSTPNLTVATALDLGKITLTADTYVKVLDAGNGLFEIYYIDNNLNKSLVGIQNGTIQISKSIDIPKLELRQILIGLFSDIAIDDLTVDGNEMFFALIKYALTEQKNVDWVFKTSFLTATQYLRKLEQFPSYIADNQSYYRDYINEVKPYRTVLREFVVDYIGNDSYSGDVTDFDLPPYWDGLLQVYRSPNGEENYDTGLITGQGKYSAWNKNHTYNLVSITVDKPGKNYISPPQIVISGNTGANAYATLNGSGGVSSITIVTPGKNLTTIPTITINGSGTGAVASPVLRTVYTGTGVGGYNLIRSVGTTIKFDRTTYTNSNVFVFWDTLTSANVGQTIAANSVIVSSSNLYRLDIPTWQPLQTYDLGSLVYNGGNTYTVTGNVYTNLFGNVAANVSLTTIGQAAYTISSGLSLPVASLTEITAGDLGTTNDRIIAFNGNIDLKLQDDGIEYPGVIIDGNTYTGSYYDAVIQSRYTDNLGVDPTQINIDGGAYVDTFSSHAPEELVPGRMYDSLNFTCYDNDQLAFRIFNDMNDKVNYYRIAAPNVAVLTSNLQLTDTVIYVDDATKLALPDRQLSKPGVIFVNGEKITYWRNLALETPYTWQANLNISVGELVAHSGNTYQTTGNIYDLYGNWANISANTQQVTNFNVIGQIQRAVGGSSPQAVHQVGSRLFDASPRQVIPNTAATSKKLISNTTYRITDVGAITFGIQLTSPISANIGDTLTQKTTVDNWTDSTYSTGAYIYYNGLTYQTTGNISIPTTPWRANTLFAANSYISNSGSTYIVTGNTYGRYFANVSSAVSLVANANIGTYKFGNIIASGNVNPVFAGNTITSVEMRVMNTVSAASTVPIIITTGSITNLPEIFDGTGFDVESFDNTPGALYLNPADTSTSLPLYSFVRNAYILGLVNLNGLYTVPSGSNVSVVHSWYNQGIRTATDGAGLINSTSPEATFLKEVRGFTPAGGSTP